MPNTKHPPPTPCRPFEPYHVYHNKQVILGQRLRAQRPAKPIPKPGSDYVRWALTDQPDPTATRPFTWTLADQPEPAASRPVPEDNFMTTEEPVMGGGAHSNQLAHDITTSKQLILPCIAIAERVVTSSENRPIRFTR